MGYPLIDLTDQSFGRLTVKEKTACPIRFVSRAYRTASWWKCECACGTTVIRSGKSLRSGRIMSCGCYRREHGKKLSNIWKEQRAITAGMRTKILRMILDQHTNAVIGRDLHVCDRRVAAIRKEVRLPAHNRFGAPQQMVATL